MNSNDRCNCDDGKRALSSIDNPEHYTSHPSGVECVTVAEHMTFNIGNVIKYCWRAGLKPADGLPLQAAQVHDLKKARWYLDREIARLGSR